MASAQHDTRPAEVPADELANAVANDDASVAVRRYFTIPGRDPFDEVEWELRDASIPGKGGAVGHHKGVEFPEFGAQTATNFVAEK